LRGAVIEAGCGGAEPATDEDGVDLGEGALKDVVDEKIGGGAMQRAKTAPVCGRGGTPAADSPSAHQANELGDEKKGGEGVGTAIEQCGRDHAGGAEDGGRGFDAVQLGKAQITREESPGPGVEADDNERDADGGGERDESRLVEECGGGRGEREHETSEKQAEGDVRVPERGALFCAEFAGLDGGSAKTDIAEENEHEKDRRHHGEETVFRGCDEPRNEDDADCFTGDADGMRPQAAAIAGSGAGGDGFRQWRGGAHGADVTSARASAVRWWWRVKRAR